MQCKCTSLPDLFKLESQPCFEHETVIIATDNWVQLRQCQTCMQLWREDKWDKYHTQFVVRIPASASARWQDYNSTLLKKEFLLNSRGGLETQQCLWAGCTALRVKGTFFCIEHLFLTDASQ